MLSFSTSIFVEDGKEIADSAENYADCIPKDLFLRKLEHDSL